MFEPVTRRSVADQVYEQLLDRIVEGRLAAGDTLPSERALSEQLGVSRTAVREALVRLEEAGLVTTRHGGESRVRDYRRSAGLDLLPRLVLDAEGGFNPVAARSALELRAAVAPDIARRCAARADASVDAELASVVEEMARADDDPTTLQELSIRFWETLADGSRNLAYRLALNTLRDLYARMTASVAWAMADELRDLDGYRAVARAVSERAPEWAADAAEAHVRLGLEPMRALVGAGREPSEEPTP